jgi:RES domain-containing protein
MADLLRLRRQVCWRIHAPKWAYVPLSGEGAARTGGRFNRPGTPALYLAFDHGTAVQEYEQELGWRPGTLCAYRVGGRFADLRGAAWLDALGSTPGDVGCAWKQMAFSRPPRVPPSWRLADALIGRNAAGAIYPSQVSATGTNLVLWRWNVRGGAQVEVLDPLKDLPRDQASWT